jgi:Tol biopolymer transport system component
MAYFTNRHHNTEVYLAPVDGSRPIRATLNEVNPVDLAWSPNGEWLAWVSARNASNDIYIMDKQGKNAVRLTDGPSQDTNPVWQP